MEWYHFSAPGRVELGGNHTDHQHGCVLAAAIDLAAEAEARPNGEGVVRVRSEGFPAVEIALDDLAPRAEERGSTVALVRGMAAAFAERGLPVGGFDARVRSAVLPGSGLSSSAAFEVLLGRILNGLFRGGADAVDIAKMGQWAENVYFGKPCGLMDQMASSVGGLVYLDFADPAAPLVERIGCDFSRSGYEVYVVDSGADHADLTAEYAAIPEELAAVCRVFGKDWLRQVDEGEFYAALPRVRAAAGDRAALRAIHVFDENRRARAEAGALRAGDFDAFLTLVNESGASSWQYLQNVSPTGSARNQELALTLALCRRLLGGRGAVRVHGGGFAGTALAFVPGDLAEPFRAGLEPVLGPNACRAVRLG